MKCEPRKIVHFGKYYFPESGGVESVTATLAHAAAFDGYFVEVVCFGNLIKRIADELVDGVRVYRFPVAGIIKSQPVSIRYILCCIKRGRAADIVHLHAPNFLAMLSTFFISKKTKIIIHWHSDVMNKGLAAYLLKPIEYYSMYRADLIIATSQSYIDHSDILRRFEDKVVVLPIGIKDKSSNNNLYLGEVNSYFKDLIRSKKIILSVGRLVNYKGFDVLINAAKEINHDSIVVIVGAGPLHNQLFNLIRLSRLEKKVYLLGGVSDNVLQMLFKRSHIFCLPSIDKSEAFGVVLLEAMSYGLPIVATNIEGSGVSWVNLNDVTGFNVPTRDPFKLANSINLILANNKLAKEMGAAARERYLEYFQEKLFVERVLAIYGSLKLRA